MTDNLEQMLIQLSPLADKSAAIEIKGKIASAKLPADVNIVIIYLNAYCRTGPHSTQCLLVEMAVDITDSSGDTAAGPRCIKRCPDCNSDSRCDRRLADPPEG
jgi:hypothetical protein